MRTVIQFELLETYIVVCVIFEVSFACIEVLFLYGLLILQWIHSLYAKIKSLVFAKGFFYI